MPEEKATKKRVTKKSPLEDRLLREIQEAGLPTPEREYKFKPKDRRAFDFAYPEHKIAIEVEGGLYTNRVFCHICKKPVMQRTKTGKQIPVFQGGRHQRGPGYERDLKKYNDATIIYGWTLIRVSSKMITSGEALEYIKTALGKAQDALHNPIV